MRRIAAHYIFPVISEPLKNGIIELDEQDRILRIIDSKGKLSESRNLEFYNGVIVPGFVNTHGHLELSELKNRLAKKRGLPFFIQQMIEYRKQPPSDFTFQSIKEADERMVQNGIVAVGDIANTETSIDVKKKSKIFYHTFVEMSGLGPDYRERFDAAMKLSSAFQQQKLSSSVVPHAPYSVSVDLFRLIQQAARKDDSILSIHNQESKEENEMFMQGSGKLFKALKAAGVNLSRWKKSERSSLRTIMDFLPLKNHILFVHNLYSTATEIKQVSENLPNSYWVLCPSSNRYIENKLPDFSVFLRFSDKVTLGTDSLASNQTLSVLDEMKTINRHFPGIAFQKMLQWASLNGARALKIEGRYGSLEKGKSPGLNLISGFDFEKMQITEDSTVKRIA
ncbi:MAG TPA: amidohydrolase family protein [Bacteroidales bacterium]|nr:amidohydrolase family protein [Bacteroidales bacterium]